MRQTHIQPRHLNQRIVSHQTGLHRAQLKQRTCTLAFARCAVINDLAVTITDDAVADSAVLVASLEQFNSCNAHGGSHQSVTQRRRTAALNVTENGGAGLDTGAVLNIMRDLLRTAYALCYDNDKVLFTGILLLVDTGDNVALKVIFDLGNDNSGSADSDTCLESDIAAMTAHDLYNRAAIMALGGVTDLIYHFNRCIHRGIKTDGVIGTGDIVIDSTGKRYAGDPLFSERSRAAERTVAADNDQTLDT